MRHREADYLFNELTEQGIADAEDLSGHLSHLFADKSAAVFSSREGRAKQTAEVLSKAFGLSSPLDTLDCLGESGGRIKFSEGLQAHLPDAVDVVLCATHNPTLGVLVDQIRAISDVGYDGSLAERETHVFTFPENRWA
ncbi:MAG: histidine phosphatase family protein [Alphaproteobacteria bacterium]|nr:histidine phosphatase family protein [Alphaproteobacteria bacterium]